jgi:hypothetical protein
VAHRSLRATIGAMASCYLFPENNSSETHCGGSKKPNQLKIKWGSMEQRLTAFSKRSPHRISNYRQAERMKSARVAEQNGQQAARFRQDANATLILLSCLD